MNNMGMERGRMQKEPVNQPESSGKAAAKIARKTAAAASTFRRGKEDPYDSDTNPTYHFSYLSRIGSRPDSPMPAPWSTVVL